MPSEGFQAQPCPLGAYQAQPQAMQGIQMSPWPFQDSQTQPQTAQGYQAQPLSAHGCQAQLQGILAGKSERKVDLLNCALADVLEPETPDQFEAELHGGWFGLPPA